MFKQVLAQNPLVRCREDDKIRCCFPNDNLPAVTGWLISMDIGEMKDLLMTDMVSDTVFEDSGFDRVLVVEKRLLQKF